LAKSESDKRAYNFRWAVAIVPLLAICCVVIALLVLLGFIELFYTMFTHHRLFGAMRS
jgi:hypothetical protein